LEVHVGNIETETGGRQVFGAVARADTEITVLIQRMLETVGRTDTTKVIVFTDGCTGLRTVLTNAGVTKPPILDWFHIAMRLQHRKPSAGNLSTDKPDRVTAKATIVAEVLRRAWGTASRLGGSGGDRCLRERIISGLGSLPKAGAEGAIIDGAANLEQKICPSP
jgi:hypothetical protein